MAKPTEYTGACYIGCVGPDSGSEDARDSIEAITRRPGDSPVNYHRATKGYEARQMHLNKWYEETDKPFILLLDRDMVFAPDTLERLRSHKLPYVSGLYMRRRFPQIAPVWYRPFRGKWPMEPWIGVPEAGKLHEIGASGWGCVLMHRDVVTATRRILKGEDEIIEDDMDVWPYDLRAVMGAIRGLRMLVDERPSSPIYWPALEHHVRTLEDEIRPLRAHNDVVGSDLRFPFFAKAAGFKFMGDPDVHPGHIIEYPLSIVDYGNFTAEDIQTAQNNTHKEVLKLRREFAREYEEAISE